MTIVDLAKARAFAATGLTCTDTAADWINELADEVESQDRTIRELRAMVADVEAEAARTQDERDQAYNALVEILATINRIMPRV